MPAMPHRDRLQERRLWGAREINTDLLEKLRVTFFHVIFHLPCRQRLIDTHKPVAARMVPNIEKIAQVDRMKLP